MRWFVGCWILSSVACSTKKATVEPAEEAAGEALEQNETTGSTADCPEGVKTPCNVPSMTAEEIAEINAANLQCVEACVAQRRVEAMSADIIQSQCQQSCDAKHFVGQVQVVPSVQEVEVPSEGQPTTE